MPMPLISMKWRTRPGARPTRSRSEGRRTSTVSSATRRWPAADQLEGGLGLADPAAPEDQHALAGHVEQAGVQHLAGGQLQGQEPGQLGGELRGRLRGAQQRDAELVARARRSRPVTGRSLVRIAAGTPTWANCDSRSQRSCSGRVMQVADLGTAHDLDLRAGELLGVARPLQPGPVHLGRGDPACGHVHPAVGDHLEVEVLHDVGQRDTTHGLSPRMTCVESMSRG